MYKNLERYADILAIFVWLLLVIYFYKIKNKNKFEKILFIFVISGLICDIYFTYIEDFLFF